jgi:hypothetical protein
MLRAKSSSLRALNLGIAVILAFSLLGSPLLAQRAFDPGNPPDLLGLNAARVFQELKPVREFYEWVDWCESAKNAIDNGKPIPASPESTFATKEIISRLDKIKQYINQMSSTNQPLFPTEPRRGESETSLRNTQRAQELYVQSLTSRINILDKYRERLSTAYAVAKATSHALDVMADRGFDMTGQLRIAAFDLSSTIPDSITKASNNAASAQASLGSVRTTVEAKYRAFDDRVNSYLQNPDKYFRDRTRNQIRGIDGSARPDTGHSPRSGDGDQGVTTSVTPYGLVTINSVLGPIETWIIPPSADVRRPPDIPPFVIPPNGEVLLAAAFPDEQAKIIVRAMTSNNELAHEFTLEGNCGGYGTFHWKNDFGESVTLNAKSYNVNEHYIDLSSANIYDEIGILGWGYLPPKVPRNGEPQPSPDRANGTPNQAVLMMVRADSSVNFPLGKDTGGTSNASIVLGSNGNWLFLLGFPNLRTRISFTSTLYGETSSREFWHPRNVPLEGNSLSGILSNDFTNGEKVNTISFTGEVNAPDGGWRHLEWRAKRVNTALWLFGAGFQLGDVPNHNDAYRAAMFVVQKGLCRGRVVLTSK